MRAALALALLALLPLLACAPADPSRFVQASERAATGEPAGTDARGNACTVVATNAPPLEAPVAGASAVFCGGWSQPAARLFPLAGGDTGPAALAALANGGLWRAWLDSSLSCGRAEPTTLDGGSRAVLLHCIRKRGGWPHLALVVAGNRGPVLVDGLAATLPVVERLVAGRTAAAPAGGRSQAMEIAVTRLAAEAYGATDAQRFEQLMALGRDLNQAERFAAAEEAFRAALAIQQRVLGPDNPNTVGPLLNLALNVSNQGRDAGPLLATAATMAPLAANPTAPARLLHYRGIDALNKGQTAEGIALLEQAEAAYARLLPPGFAAGGEQAGSAMLLDTMSQAAVLGLAEARRYRGVALGQAGRQAEGEAAIRDARRLLRGAGLEVGMLVGRSLRSQGSSLEAAAAGQAARLHEASAARFAAAAPGERPEAMAHFLAGGRLLQAGNRAAALGEFAAGEALLRRNHQGLPAELVLPYLDALAAEAASRPADAAQLQADMFEIAQLARGETATRLVAQAAARLNAAGAGSQVGAAVRRMQQADLALRTLLAQRDLGTASGPARAALDERIRTALAQREEAEAEAAAAAPGYRQLLLAVADDAAVARVLRPREALVSMLLGPEHGYAFAVRADGRVLARRVALGEAAAAGLVRRIRAAMTVGEQGLLRFDAKAAAALHQALLAPLAPALDGVESLLVAADGPLLAMPFSLLLTEATDAANPAQLPWLIRRHAVVHVPSVEALVQMRGSAAGSASAAPLPYAGFGDPVLPNAAQLKRAFPPQACADDARRAAGLAPLPGTRAEVVAAGKLSGVGVAELHLGQGFTAQVVRAQPLERYKVLHFATHALMAGELNCLREPSLLVSPPAGAADGATAFLGASALLELKLDADLVVLSACNTGTTEGGSALGGEGLSATARAAFFAGARGVMATHWVLDDAAAAHMVAEVLARQRRDGNGSAAALRQAQLQLLDQAGQALPERWSHPYYWAPFALLGDGLRG